MLGPMRFSSVLVQFSGTRTFRVKYRLKDLPKRLAMSRGRVEAITLDEARESAREAIRKAAMGEYPRVRSRSLQAS